MDVQTIPPQIIRAEVARLEERLFQSCPMAIALIDDLGVVVWANMQAREMVYCAGDDLVGTNIVDVVHPDDLMAVADSMGFAIETTSQAFGPMRIRYIDAAGKSRYTYLWAQNFSDDPEINGMIVVLSKEAAHDVLGAAVSSAAAGEGIDETLGLIAHSMEVAPFEAHAAVLRYTDTTLLDVDVVKSTNAPNYLDRVDPELPWIRALRLGLNVDQTDLAQFGPEFDPEVTGIEYVWCRPIPTADDTSAVLVVCTKKPYGPTPNQLVEMGRAIEVAQVALRLDSDRTRLIHAATHDHLTGLANRELLATFESDLSEAAVFFIDLDHFKQINDEHGHAIGDEVLRVTAKRIDRSIRSGDLAVRIGGDEFVVVCHPRCSAEDAEQVAHRILNAVARPISIEGLLLDVSASVGIALGSLDCTLAELMASADSALLQVKSSDKGAYNFA